MTQLILLERVEKLGLMGDVVNVRPGYARNFLIPQKKAMRATKANVELFAQKKVHIEAENLKRKEEALKVAAKMDNLSIIVIRQSGESGQLYGSVNTRDVADGVSEKGFAVNRTQVTILKPIKDIGLHTAIVKLHADVSVNVTVNVSKSVEEAHAQAQKAAKADKADKSENTEKTEADSAENA